MFKIPRFLGRRAPRLEPKVAQLAEKATRRARREVLEQLVTERSVRTFADWTPARIRTAQAMADSGSLMYAADLCDSIFADDRVKGVLGTRTRGLLRLPIEFKPHEGEDPTDESQALEADFWNMYPEAELQQLVDWGLTLGVGLAEQRWEPGKNGRLLPRLEIWHPRHLRFDDQTRTWRLSTQEAEITIEAGSGKWILYTPYGAKRPWQQGAWRALALWWLLKRYAVQDWATYGEVHGNPIRTATETDPNKVVSKAERQELAEDLEALGGVTAVALPQGVDLKLVEATARTWETFKAQIEAANTGMAIAIAGQNLTSEVQGGSLAAASVHDNIRQDLIESDEQTLSTTLHNQGLVWWTAFNFGNEDRAPWVRWQVLPEDKREIFQYHIENGIVTINEVRARLGLEPVEGGDELIQPVSATEQLKLPKALNMLQGRKGVVKLSSGDDPKTAKGFVRGQLYVDSLADRGVSLSGLSKMLGELQAVVEEATDVDGLRRALLRKFEQLDPDDLGPLFESLMLADLAGRYAVQEDL